MWKRKKGRKFHREKDQRRAFIRSLLEALIMKEKIKTTLARAKEVSSAVEKLITKAKSSNLSARREISKKISYKAAKKLIDKLAVQYKERKGGYTRILKIGPRKGDGAEMAIIEFVK